MGLGRSSADSRVGRRAQRGTDLSGREDGSPQTTALVSPPVPQYGVLLGEVLVRRGALTTEALNDALIEQPAAGQRLGVLLTELGLITERDLAHALAVQVGLEVADLSRTAPDAAVAELLGESKARSLQAIPFSISDDGVVQIALSDPSPDIAEDVLRSLARRTSDVVAT
jgi:type IV pilus assembly protein PilB